MLRNPRTVIPDNYFNIIIMRFVVYINAHFCISAPDESIMGIQKQIQPHIVKFTRHRPYRWQGFIGQLRLYLDTLALDMGANKSECFFDSGSNIHRLWWFTRQIRSHRCQKAANDVKSTNRHKKTYPVGFAK